MPSPLGRELASSGLLQPIGKDSAAKVELWLREQLTAPVNKAFEDEARVLLAASDNDVSAAAATLIRDHTEDARSSVAPSSASRSSHSEHPHSLVSWDGFHAALRVALQAVGNTLHDVLEPTRHLQDRAGSKNAEKKILKEVDSRAADLVEDANTALSRSFGKYDGRLGVRALAIGTKVSGREVDNDRDFCDLWLRLEFAIPTHGVSEIRDVPINVKAVSQTTRNGRPSRSRINSGGMRMLSWMMLADAVGGSRAKVVALITESMTKDACETPDSDYVLWVWSKPEAGRETPAPRVIPLLRVLTDGLAFNDSQAWPAIQLCVDRSYDAWKQESVSSCREARERLLAWLAIEQLKAGHLSEVGLEWLRFLDHDAAAQAASLLKDLARMVASARRQVGNGA